MLLKQNIRQRFIHEKVSHKSKDNCFKNVDPEPDVAFRIQKYIGIVFLNGIDLNEVIIDGVPIDELLGHIVAFPNPKQIQLVIDEPNGVEEGQPDALQKS